MARSMSQCRGFCWLDAMLVELLLTDFLLHV